MTPNLTLGALTYGPQHTINCSFNLPKRSFVLRFMHVYETLACGIVIKVHFVCTRTVVYMCNIYRAQALFNLPYFHHLTQPSHTHCSSTYCAQRCQLYLTILAMTLVARLGTKLWKKLKPIFCVYGFIFLIPEDTLHFSVNTFDIFCFKKKKPQPR